MLEYNNIKFTVNTQSSVRIEKDGLVIYVDPFKIEGEPHDANYVFVTHSHYDHYSLEDIKKVANSKTVVFAPEDVDISNKIKVKPEEDYALEDFTFKTVRAYNKLKPFHLKIKNWVGYLINIDGTIIYVSGDTDYIDEMNNIKCDIAFLPIGGVYTMDYKEAAKAACAIDLRCVVPTHYGSIVGRMEDGEKFKEKVLEENENIRVEILIGEK